MVESFWLLAGVILYTYLGYPALLGLLASWFRRPVRKGEPLPSLTLLIAAYNEEAVIGKKLENSCSLDYPSDRLEIVVVSDGSTDRTDEIVRQFPDVRLDRVPVRGGKTAALNHAVPRTKGEIIVFSDANPIYRPDALRKLVRAFADPEVGGVSGDVRLSPEGVTFGEAQGLYYRYERYIQRKESELGSMIGCDGAMYAIRRECFVAPPPFFILDDFLISMAVTRQGYRVIYEPEAIAVEDSPPALREEFRRKIRVLAGGFQTLLHRAGIPTSPLLLWCYLSHKVARWFCPFCLLFLFLLDLFLADRAGYRLLLFGQIAFYLWGGVGYLFEEKIGGKWRKLLLPTYFCVENLAGIIGFFRAIGGKERVTWKSVGRRV
ncbi:MAG: glycosyltransferase family 2 protein [Deltaproteobacteria bacterium]|nr:MAG: glycosyltransferase family 2 protein [Deltaproteobacteria bacterium]